MQLNGDCNLGCVFCSAKKEKDVFGSYGFSQCIENEMSYCFSQVESFIFKFCGNFQLPLIKENVVRKIQESFPASEKVFYLHGEYLTPENCDTFMSLWGRLHYSSSSSIQIVLSASNEYFYKIMTGSDNYQRVKKQIQYFVSRRLRNYTKIHLVFIATTINIEDLPDFVRLAADLGVDKVICSYNYIYTSTQKYLSCFFKQELTNKMLYEAEFLANNLNIETDLPPRFGQKEYPKSTVCREPFSQIMLDSHGHILPCDASEDCHEILGNGKDFFDVWNSQYYQNLRKSLLEGNAPCFKHCLRANPCAVNDFKAHVIHRGVKRDQDIDVLWGDNF
jgi:MoaA/NifB/PqqE/SkfB family radical SAM enzyme